MAEDARRKDDQPAAMLTRMDTKDKQMTELIMQVSAMKTGGCYSGNDIDEKSQGTRNNKRKAVDSVAGRGSGSGKGGTYLELKSNNGQWTHPQKCGFPWTRKESFKTSAIKWDSSWPANKQAYYNARKATRFGYAFRTYGLYMVRGGRTRYAIDIIVGGTAQ